jgi:tRNA-5-taurinomethyluridine 2-sulfurtransferase
VRELATQYDLPTQTRKDSQGICFLGKLKFDDFIGHYLGERPGDILDYSTREVLGRHRGLWYHTIGQRKGIGTLLHPRTVNRGPFYVVSKDLDQNILYISNDLQASHAARREFYVHRMNWITGAAPPSGSTYRYRMKLRHSPAFVHGIIQRIEVAEDEKEVWRVELDQEDKGIAQGQFLALYDDDECLGGGVISDYATLA